MPQPEGSRFRLEVFYNWPGLLGVALIAVNLAAALAVFAADLFVGVEYVGVIYALLGLATLLGVAIACVGGLVGLRRRRHGIPSRVLEPWTLDLMRARDRRFALAGLVATILLIGVFASATSQGVRYMESRDFCVNVCHAVMEPEGTAALHSPHANFRCADCHVGIGAVHFASAKLNGMRQLWGVVSGDYDRPIRVHAEGLRTAEALCEHCHARERWIGTREKRFSFFAGDDESTPHPLVMLLDVGGIRPGSGKGEGIHFHMLLDHKVEYVAADPEKSGMLWVRVTDASGEVRIYRNGDEGSDEAIAGKPVETMSCLDCHNRPAHQFRAPTALMNELLADGRIDRGLPSIKVEGVKLLEASYPDRATALATIEQTLRERYPSENGQGPDAARVDAAVEAIQAAWSRNSFPHMKANWQAYPSHLSHLDTPGCFRCHNDEMLDEEGEALFQSCNDCHIVLAQGEGSPVREVDLERGVPFYHFTDDDTFEDYEDCASCHNGGSDIY
jgi:nitrate/TMAO reductase-like tetraheme cytochrome c subunit